MTNAETEHRRGAALLTHTYECGEIQTTELRSALGKSSVTPCPPETYCWATGMWWDLEKVVSLVGDGVICYLTRGKKIIKQAFG